MIPLLIPFFDMPFTFQCSHTTTSLQNQRQHDATRLKSKGYKAYESSTFTITSLLANPLRRRRHSRRLRELNDQVPLRQTLDLIQPVSIPDHIDPSLLLVLITTIRSPTKSPTQQLAITVCEFTPPRQSVVVHDINKLVRRLGAYLLERLALAAQVLRVNFGRGNGGPLCAAAVGGVRWRGVEQAFCLRGLDRSVWYARAIVCSEIKSLTRGMRWGDGPRRRVGLIGLDRRDKRPFCGGGVA